jgi:hypothetical protein
MFWHDDKYLCIIITAYIMLHTITTITEELELLIKDDPVRPEIPMSDRINTNSRIYLLKNGDNTSAVTCVKFLNDVPKAVEFVVRCRNFDGGFGAVPGAESHAGQVGGASLTNSLTH